MKRAKGGKDKKEEEVCDGRRVGGEKRGELMGAKERIKRRRETKLKNKGKRRSASWGLGVRG